ncbi:MAG: hypothetical protein ACOWWM_10240 [Desulfobacterales bacterium]
MILTPAIIALVAGHLLLVLFGFGAMAVALQILRHWDLRSGSERQIRMERRTYLVSTVMAYLMGFEIFSLFLFVYTADNIHPLFVGAMCAAGSLHANGWGYPTLVLKLVNVLLCGVWLLINHADNQAPDYPMIRFKYKWLIAVMVLLGLESLFQLNYFRGIEANMITSCCGTLFGETSGTVAGDIASFSPRGMQVLFFLSAVLTLRSGVYFQATGRGAVVYSLLSLWLFWLTIGAVISFISVYYYELPTHHCPFDILQQGYHYVGYLLYAALVGAGIFGAGVGIIERFADSVSMEKIIPRLQKYFCLISMGCYIVVILISGWPLVFSDFRLIH